MQKFTPSFLKLISSAAVVASLAPAALADVQSGADDAQPGSVGSDGSFHSSVPTHLFGANGIFHTVANLTIGLIGAIAVLVLIYGGFLYVTSVGDAKRVTAAKDTILYAVIGIVVSLLAFAIVTFVSSSLT